MSAVFRAFWAAGLLRSYSCGLADQHDTRSHFLFDGSRSVEELAPLTTSFDSLCRRLESIPEFLCECTPEIPNRSIQCQSTEICSFCQPQQQACGRFFFNVEFMGPDVSQLQSCVMYTQTPETGLDYRDGCFTILYAGQDTPPSGCSLTFRHPSLDDVQECQSCSLCDDVTEGISIEADCTCVLPAASIGCTPVQLDAFFLGFREGDCGTPTSGAAPRVTLFVTTVSILLLVLGKIA
jgi:hypothetical protein